MSNEYQTVVPIFIIALVNLYRRHGEPQALALTDKDLELLQEAAVFFHEERDDNQLQDYTLQAAKLHRTLIEKNVSRAQADLLRDALVNHHVGIFQLRIHCLQDIEIYNEMLSVSLDPFLIDLILHPEKNCWVLHKGSEVITINPN
ncbi:MAG: hypothetical protein ABI597_07355 [Gammaproteobacteria bacterium]